ncbi:MAG: hypothetical protein OEZ01_03845 [Candidatus Heimdallarchaeota archaeon]|nr:hypothetical protein [Candidatus Heimdallarchaeota archaeon]MDH5645112.1 hypothetical protein [Candidatus Heimdallarchaeota archaeon]
MTINSQDAKQSNDGSTTSEDILVKQTMLLNQYKKFQDDGAENNEFWDYIRNYHQIMITEIFNDRIEKNNSFIKNSVIYIQNQTNQHIEMISNMLKNYLTLKTDQQDDEQIVDLIRKFSVYSVNELFSNSESILQEREEFVSQTKQFIEENNKKKVNQ